MGQLHVRLLKTARHRIAGGRNGVICWALDAAVDTLANEGAPRKELERRSRQLQTVVQIRLGHHSVLEGWLAMQGYIPFFWWAEKYDEAKVRRTRLAWIDALIKEFRSAK